MEQFPLRNPETSWVSPPQLLFPSPFSSMLSCKQKHQSPRFLLEGVWLHTLPAATWGSSFYLAYIYDLGGGEAGRKREKIQRKKEKEKKGKIKHYNR